ncbi:unnamed protein product [Symbiodinium sp. CCMP2592]|nr:unnamed protein product [Symbiodinium sp. CCMP2592]
MLQSTPAVLLRGDSSFLQLRDVVVRIMLQDKDLARPGKRMSTADFGCFWGGPVAERLGLGRVSLSWCEDTPELRLAAGCLVNTWKASGIVSEDDIKAIYDTVSASKPPAAPAPKPAAKAEPKAKDPMELRVV